MWDLIVLIVTLTYTIYNRDYGLLTQQGLPFLGLRS
jgi:hypothetical protein